MNQIINVPFWLCWTVKVLIPWIYHREPRRRGGGGWTQHVLVSADPPCCWHTHTHTHSGFADPAPLILINCHKYIRRDIHTRSQANYIMITPSLIITLLPAAGVHGYLDCGAEQILIIEFATVNIHKNKKNQCILVSWKHISRVSLPSIETGLNIQLLNIEIEINKTKTISIHFILI